MKALRISQQKQMVKKVNKVAHLYPEGSVQWHSLKGSSEGLLSVGLGWSALWEPQHYIAAGPGFFRGKSPCPSLGRP